MWMTKEEEQFLRDNIKSTYSVLEWGAGESTIQLAEIADHIVSIEHNPSWVTKVSGDISPKIDLICCPSSTLYDSDRDGDGNISQFLEYVIAPLRLRRAFDVILIDGRARASCALVSPLVSNAGTKVFIHDYDLTVPCRQNYAQASYALDFVQSVGSLAMFTPKRNLICAFKI